MCEAGLGATDSFQRAIAHHTYIDQAIRARDGRLPRAAYRAYDIGEARSRRATCCVPRGVPCTARSPIGGGNWASAPGPTATSS